MGTAQCRQRTQQTARRGGQTDGGSQFHQRLVKVAGAVLRHNRKQQLAERLFGLRQTDVIAAAQDAGNYPQDVAVHSGHGDTKGDGGDGSGGVVTDAGQSRLRFFRNRKYLPNTSAISPLGVINRPYECMFF